MHFTIHLEKKNITIIILTLIMIGIIDFLIVLFRMIGTQITNNTIDNCLGNNNTTTKLSHTIQSKRSLMLFAPLAAVQQQQQHQH